MTTSEVMNPARASSTKSDGIKVDEEYSEIVHTNAELAELMVVAEGEERTTWFVWILVLCCSIAGLLFGAYNSARLFESRLILMVCQGMIPALSPALWFPSAPIWDLKNYRHCKRYALIRSLFSMDFGLHLSSFVGAHYFCDYFRRALRWSSCGCPFRLYREETYLGHRRCPFHRRSNCSSSLRYGLDDGEY